MASQQKQQRPRNQARENSKGSGRKKWKNIERVSICAKFFFSFFLSFNVFIMIFAFHIYCFIYALLLAKFASFSSSSHFSLVLFLFSVVFLSFPVLLIGLNELCKSHHFNTPKKKRTNEPSVTEIEMERYLYLIKWMLCVDCIAQKKRRRNSKT